MQKKNAPLKEWKRKEGGKERRVPSGSCWGRRGWGSSWLLEPVSLITYLLLCIAGSRVNRRGWWWMRETNLETREASKRGRSKQQEDKAKGEEEIDLIKKMVERKLMTKKKRRQCGGNWNAFLHQTNVLDFYVWIADSLFFYPVLTDMTLFFVLLAINMIALSLHLTPHHFLLNNCLVWAATIHVTSQPYKKNCWCCQNWNAI